MLNFEVETLMKIFLSLLLTLFASMPVLAEQEKFDAREFAQKYFDVWSSTQAPDASADDIEAYLSLLTDDVGHQHLPYDPDSARDPEGKNRMREGMTYYLGAHSEYRSSLDEVLVGFDVVVIKYSSFVKAIHPQTDELIERSGEMVEVLELENDKVSVIRKYSE